MQAAQKATRTIPIVMAFVSDPVAHGFVASLARPGGNITGLAVATPETASKRLQFLQEVAPADRRIAVLTDPGQRDISAADLKGVEAAARASGVQLQVWEARSSGELDRAFTAITRERVAGILVLPEHGAVCQSSADCPTGREVSSADVGLDAGIS